MNQVLPLDRPLRVHPMLAELLIEAEEALLRPTTYGLSERELLLSLEVRLKRADQVPAPLGRHYTAFALVLVQVLRLVAQCDPVEHERMNRLLGLVGHLLPIVRDERHSAWLEERE